LQNSMQGYGGYEWPDGSRYKGMWVENMMHGKGVMHHSDGTVY